VSPSLPAPRFVEQSRFGRCQARSDPPARAAPTLGHRGRTGDPLYGVRRTLRTRVPLLSTRPRSRLTSVFADGRHIAVTMAWSIYQRIIAAYSHPDRRRGKTMMGTIIDSLRAAVPAGLEELAQLGRTVQRRRADVLAYFDHHTSNQPTEAIDGRLQALHRNALGFRKPYPLPNPIPGNCFTAMPSYASNESLSCSP
jgi:Transposase